jgi:hypothetical protein
MKIFVFHSTLFDFKVETAVLNSSKINDIKTSYNTKCGKVKVLPTDFSNLTLRVLNESTGRLLCGL